MTDAKTKKMVLLVPTLGANVGDEIDVDADHVDALVANGSVAPKSSAAGKAAQS